MSDMTTAMWFLLAFNATLVVLHLWLSRKQNEYVLWLREADRRSEDRHREFKEKCQELRDRYTPCSTKAARECAG